jgi:uncharacterized membrane protein (DUF373 family)
MLLFLVLEILIGTAKLFLSLKDMVTVGHVTGTYLNTLSDVLSLFLLIELSRALADCLDNKRLRVEGNSVPPNRLTD